MTLIAQLTDLHLRADGADPFHDPYRATRDAFAAIRALDVQPDAIVLTGDINDHSTSDYGPALALLHAAPVPVLPMPGNHDDPDAFRAAFQNWADFAPDHLSFTADLGDLHLITLETTLPNGLPGLEARHLAWLDAQLRAASKPVLLALHHPPFPTGLPHLERHGFAERAVLADMLQTGQIVRLIAGHSHRAISALWQGVSCSTAPAIGHGLGLSFSGAALHRPMATTPGFELHHWQGAQMISHTVSLPR